MLKKVISPSDKVNKFVDLGPGSYRDQVRLAVIGKEGTNKLDLNGGQYIEHCNSKTCINCYSLRA